MRIINGSKKLSSNGIYAWAGRQHLATKCVSGDHCALVKLVQFMVLVCELVQHFWIVSSLEMKAGSILITQRPKDKVPSGRAQPHRAQRKQE